MSSQVPDSGMRDPYRGQTPVLKTLLVLATNQPSQFAPSSWVLPLSTTASFPQTGPFNTSDLTLCSPSTSQSGLGKSGGMEGQCGEWSGRGMDDSWGWSQEVVELQSRPLAAISPQHVLVDLSGEGMVDTHSCPGQTLWAQKNEPRFTKPALANLPDTDSSMAFIFRLRSSVSRWMDCRWNLCRISWLDCLRRPWVGECVNLASPVEAGSIGSGSAGGGGFFWTGVCTGADSISITGGAPMLISRPKMSEGVGIMGSLISSSQVNSKMFLMPLGTETPAFRQLMSSLEMWASSLGAVAVYCRYSSRLLLISFMALEHACC